MKLTDLLTMILIPKKATASLTDPMATKCEHVKNYIDENFTSTIQLEELANQFFVSKFYLSREFKKIYGQSIIDYTISKRIALAKQLLRYTDSSIHEIALECGFQDQGYFNKQFKKLERITGREYRKQWC